MKSVLGAVLAGGQSRRFGRDKATVQVAGVTLLDRAAAALEGQCEDVVVVASEPGFWRWPTIPDRRAPCGPLGGIEAALAYAAEEGLEAVVVLACDYPLVSVKSVGALAQAVADGAAAACAGREGDPPYHPLCAAYSVDALPVAKRLLDEGERAAKALHRACDGTIVHVPESELVNVNVPEDIAAVERELAGRVAGQNGGGDLAG